MMAENKFQFGDSVRHARKPEWGLGSVVKVENIASNGNLSQRLRVRFSNAGLKILNTNQADLEIIINRDQVHTTLEAESVDDLDRMGESEWLTDIAEKKVEEMMLSLPLETRDVFDSLQSRITVTLELYRFDRSGKGLMDWAVAQSRLNDPLSRFSRHELEFLFDRWVTIRDAHLQKLLFEARSISGLSERLISSMPKSTQDAVRRLVAQR